MAAALLIAFNNRRRHRTPRLPRELVFRDRDNPLDYMGDDDLIAKYILCRIYIYRILLPCSFYRMNREANFYKCHTLEDDLKRPTWR